MRRSATLLTLLAILLLAAAPAAARFGAPPAPPARGAAKAHGATAGARGPRRLADTTSDSIWPAPALNENVANSTWTHVAGSANMGATGPDCPYTQHGPDASLAVCQAACNSAGAGVCTDLNWNPSIPDCVFRRCEDPLHPVLSPAQGYTVYAITRPVITFFGIDPKAFAITATGFSDATLAAAIKRAPAAAFPYGTGGGAAGGSWLPAQLKGLSIDVAGAAPLAEGVDESYSLTISAANGCSIKAPTVFGALHALETFFQLVVYNLTDGTYMAASTTIVDAPRFPYRGVMIDTSRHFMSVSVIKEVVDMMAAVKLNTLSIHLTDDQSWPLVVPSAPELSLQSAYSNFSHVYTPAAVHDLVQYAALRGVRVLPEFDSPSHFGALMGAYPQFAAPTTGGGLCMVDPSREEVFDFLAGIWSDIASEFPADQLRIGGDEFQGCWSDSPQVMAWVNKTFGAKGTIYDAYHYYVRRMIGFARAHGRTTQAWLDVAGFPDANETWQRDYSDVTLNVWTGCYSGSWQDDVSRFTRLNGSVVVSGPYYITANQPGAPHFDWKEMFRVDLANFTDNSTEAIAHVRGGELCVWDDAAGTDSGDLAVQITPFIFGVSESWWSPQAATSGQDPDESRAHVQRCRLIQRGYASHPIFAFSTWCPREFEWAQVPAV
jgi:hexosaminidase